VQQSAFTSGKHQNLWCSGLACPRAYGNAGSREALGTRMGRRQGQPRPQGLPRGGARAEEDLGDEVETGRV
jgi:hypothetical protein